MPELSPGTYPVGEAFELSLHLSLQGGQLGFVAAIALVGLLAKSVTSWRRWSQRRRISRKAALPPRAARPVMARSTSSLMREARVILRR